MSIIEGVITDLRVRDASKHPEFIEATVRIRRNMGLAVKPEAEQYDGQTAFFKYAWDIEPSDGRYPNEAAYICPEGWVIAWFAFGDLEIVRRTNEYSEWLEWQKQEQPPAEQGDRDG